MIWIRASSTHPEYIKLRGKQNRFSLSSNICLNVEKVIEEKKKKKKKLK